MARTADDTLLRIAKNNDEIEIETRRDAKSPVHRTTIWIVPTTQGAAVRSYKGKRGRWWQEATANKNVTIRVGRRKLQARAEPVRSAGGIREVSAAYREKYAGRWPDETKPMLRSSVLPTTLRLKEVKGN